MTTPVTPNQALLPCPRCGGDKPRLVSFERDFSYGWLGRIICDDCGHNEESSSHGLIGNRAQEMAEAEAITAWNHRIASEQPLPDGGDSYVVGQYLFNTLRTFLATAGINASDCNLVIELPDRDAQRNLVSTLQRHMGHRGSPRSAGRIGNHSGKWQGVDYEFSVKGWRNNEQPLPVQELVWKLAADIMTALRSNGFVDGEAAEALDEFEAVTLTPMLTDAIERLSARSIPDIERLREAGVVLMNWIQDGYPAAARPAKVDAALRVFRNPDAIESLSARTGDVVESVARALKAQMEDDDVQNLPSSMCRERGLTWLEGWFDLGAALQPHILSARSEGDVEP